MNAGPEGTLAFVALGANLGEPVATVRRALDRLQRWSSAPLLRSSLWRSTPLDCPPGSPPFINAVAGLRPLPQQTPGQLLRDLLALETEFGARPRRVPNEPRHLDLDLIAFGNCERSGPELILPHPRAHQRRFVLAPLAEIAPELVLPGQHKTVQQLLDELKSDEEVSKVV